jgi:hypothetical protein
MVLTFKSTARETYTLLGLDAEGNNRSVTAVRSEANPRRWEMTYTSPTYNTVASFDGVAVLDAMAKVFDDQENRYREAQRRGHKPEPMLRDTSIQVSDLGETAIGHNPSADSYYRPRPAPNSRR